METLRTLHQCRACGWRWLSHRANPHRCPSCLTTLWRREDRRVRHGLYARLRALRVGAVSRPTVAA